MPRSAGREGGYDAVMKVRIGISNTDKLVEIEVEDAKSFRKEIERAVADGGMGWFTDAKGRSVGIPARNVAFIEMDDPEASRTVGFAPAV
jgi:hypothetical protein